MALFIASLNSGSNGNCYYIGNSTEAVLIDAGISCRETERRMKRLNLPIENVKAIFISHEHTDHITGIATLSKKYQLPVYITPPTFTSCGIKIQKDLIRSFNPNDVIGVGRLSVTAFSKSHDACDPHSFMISGNRVNIGVFTDIGVACKNVVSHFKECHAAFLEANYCEDMLLNGSYPYFLKKRISSDNGHLSNNQALELFMKHKNKYLSHLILSHLSKNNNDPELVDRIFREKAGKVKVVVASRYKETEVYFVTAGVAPVVLKPKPVMQAQLSLF